MQNLTGLNRTKI